MVGCGNTGRQSGEQTLCELGRDRFWSTRLRRIRISGKMIAVVAALVLLVMVVPTANGLVLNYTSKTCSKSCESINCDNPHTLRYGKYCGVGYTGCPAQAPCDGLDTCCEQHDLCIGLSPANYPNHTCSGNLKRCVERYLITGAPVFRGSNCSAMSIEHTIAVAVDGTTYYLGPGSSPQPGSAAFMLQSFHSISLFVSGLCAVLFLHPLTTER